jgi:cyclohexanone monooxygenase
VIVVGAGFSGLGAAIKLREAGFDDFVLLEDGDGVGGTWHWNTYPGVAVDIPSFSYQFSFAQRSDWSRTYAPGSELKRYADDLADQYDVRRNVRFHTRVQRAEWDEDAALWRLSLGGGEELTGRYLLNASGALTTPKLPDIDGIDTFAGTTVHTARWPEGLDLTGKRVAVIGTGASAVQVIPEIAPDVAELTVFQRTPIWCFPKLDLPLPGPLQLGLRLPGARTAARLAAQSFVEVTFPIAAHYHRWFPLASQMEKAGKRYLAQQVEDRETRRKLTPAYGVGCKRPSFHNSYLATYNRANVHLETTPITEVTPTGVRTSDGTLHEIDVLILATGFQVLEGDSVPTYELVGRDGTLSAYWDKNRLQAYQGVSVPGFPNFFTVFGPYGYNGSSYFALIEAQVHHIVRCLRRARRVGADKVEVTEEANERYFASMLRRRDKQVFWQESCSQANSYYFDKHGDVALRPNLTLESVWHSRRFPLEDYEFSAV